MGAAEIPVSSQDALEQALRAMNGVAKDPIAAGICSKHPESWETFVQSAEGKLFGQGMKLPTRMNMLARVISDVAREIPTARATALQTGDLDTEIARLNLKQGLYSAAALLAAANPEQAKPVRNMQSKFSEAAQKARIRLAQISPPLQLPLSL